MITDRNKFSFVTICLGLCVLLTTASVSLAQATSSTQQESNEQHQQQQKQKQAIIATISVVDNKDKEEATNAIINEQTNEVVHAFSPRLDYSNEWRPVGRGDPLKNDPTFDYSPPTLEHVRYWAETTKESNSKEELARKQDATNNIHFTRPNKQHNSLLVKPNEHLRSGSLAYQQHPHPHPNQYAMPHQPYVMKNAKGETPLLQPKYQSVRRSYYAQQLPTRLMPPPMQMNSPPINTFNVPMKPSPETQVNMEYRHSMSGPAPLSTGAQSASAASHMKAPQHYNGMSTPSSMSWIYNSPPAMQHSQQQLQQNHHYFMPSSSGAPVTSKPKTQQTSSVLRTHSPYDSYAQDTHHYVSFMRPSMNSMSSRAPQEPYSPNSLHHSSSYMKQSGLGRKPWLQELLRKEVVKTSANPSYATSTNKIVFETTKPVYETTKPFHDHMPSTKTNNHSGFTPYTPVTHVPAPPTIATTTTTTHAPQPAFVPLSSSSTYQPLMSSTLTPFTTRTTKHVIYTPTITTTPRTPTTTTSSRLLIPTTSNLASRPTVTSMQMTTDSLFSHYKQPEAPMRGPMYLIIEGHSKVKKYGKNGINLNLPKIVPVVPKREPVVRVAEPGEEKRGTPETFQVEHLHVKSSTATPKFSTTISTSTTAKPSTITTEKPKTPATTAKTSTTVKAPLTSKLDAKSSTTQTTLKLKAAATTTTTLRLAATTATPKINSTAATNNATVKSAAENTKLLTTTAKPTTAVPLLKLELPNEPPTGMQGLLSLLDSSLGNLFAESTLDLSEMPAHLTTPSTILQALNSSTPLHNVITQSQTALVPVAANARIGTNANHILTVADADGSTEVSYTTDVPPREVRQVFDYDQHPEIRLKDFVVNSVVDGVRAAAVVSSDEGAPAFYEDEFDEYEDENNNDDDDVGGNGSAAQIKRYDKLIYDGEGEGEFVGDYEDVKLTEFGMNMGDVRMQTKLA
ncbi:uncharacterized protein [Eurosta solidaginis]|uniref:uncharacterized protein n=1 Tax=Eurosta solidaginis TaxID=178769 RepID=UPI00353073D8